jgi:hypothetical protein|tara:strand:+ start:302 stop:964 length:663 start_codon:yes stop_codon:yes gene_type:complete
MQSTMAQAIRDYFSEPEIVADIVKELNQEIALCTIFRNLKREYDHGVTDAPLMTFRELNAEDRNEVFVYLGRLLESVLTCKLSLRRGFKVSKDRNSSGDVVINDIIWEIKGTTGNNSWTGSTHATKKEDDGMNFIGVKYGINEDTKVFDIINGVEGLIGEIFIGVFEKLNFVRKGSATQSNSRTSLLISLDDYDTVKEQVCWGNFRIPQRNGKYLQLEPA